jgi:hypothetical protein
MARVKMTKTSRFALIFLRVYLLLMLVLILAKFLQVFK